jgi:hypothetical protein
MPLSEKEIRVLVEKLRGKYLDYAKKHSPKWFDINAFDERLSMALRNRMNLEGFILAEITNFEKVREKYEKKKSLRPFSERVDRIIEENVARIKKYPEKKFHKNAGQEISHFYGAGADLAQYYFPIIPYLLKEEPHRTKALRFEETFDFLFFPRGKKHPKRVEDHILLLDRRGVSEIEIEKDRNEYLKESAFLLHGLVEFLDGLMLVKNAEWELPIKFDRPFLEGEKRKKVQDNFARHTVYGAILKVRETAVSIIEDFRITAFRAK